MIPIGDQYIELLGVVDPEAARASEYGRSLLRAIATGDRLVRWSLRTDAIHDVAARPDGELLTWRAAGLDFALADATLPFFMQWDRAEQYPGLLPAAHPNHARRVTELAVTPRDAERFERWTAGAEAPLRIGSGATPGLASVTVETSAGALTLSE